MVQDTRSSFRPTLPARYSRVTQVTIAKTICVKDWRHDPSARELHDGAQEQPLVQGHYADKNPSRYEEDHLISLELGGAPCSTKNLWPRALEVGAQERPERERLEEEGLRRDADAPAGTQSP